jgi:hypothetical protein
MAEVRGLLAASVPLVVAISFFRLCPTALLVYESEALAHEGVDLHVLRVEGPLRVADGTFEPLADCLLVSVRELPAGKTRRAYVVGTLTVRHQRKTRPSTTLDGIEQRQVRIEGFEADRAREEVGEVVHFGSLSPWFRLAVGEVDSTRK